MTMLKIYRSHTVIFADFRFRIDLISKMNDKPSVRARAMMHCCVYGPIL